jgi:hypothetical protein
VRRRIESFWLSALHSRSDVPTVFRLVRVLPCHLPVTMVALHGAGCGGGDEDVPAASRRPPVCPSHGAGAAASRRLAAKRRALLPRGATLALALVLVGGQVAEGRGARGSEPPPRAGEAWGGRSARRHLLQAQALPMPMQGQQALQQPLW